MQLTQKIPLGQNKTQPYHIQDKTYTLDMVNTIQEKETIQCNYKTLYTQGIKNILHTHRNIDNGRPINNSKENTHLLIPVGINPCIPRDDIL